MSNIKKEWMGKPILSPKDHDELEVKAAVAQYGLKMPKQQAEEYAYKEYAMEKAKSAAAHHLAGINQSQRAGDQVSAQKHGALYNMHAQNAGFDPIGPPPEEVAVAAHKSENKYRFKPHAADMFLVQKHDEIKKAGWSSEPKSKLSFSHFPTQSQVQSPNFPTGPEQSAGVTATPATGLHGAKGNWATNTQMFRGGGKIGKPGKGLGGFKIPGLGIKIPSFGGTDNKSVKNGNFKMPGVSGTGNPKATNPSSKGSRGGTGPSKLEQELMGGNSEPAMPELPSAPETVSTGKGAIADLQGDMGIKPQANLGMAPKPNPMGNSPKVGKLVDSAFANEPPTIQQAAAKMTKPPKAPQAVSSPSFPKQLTGNHKEPKGGLAAIKELK